MSRKFTGTFDDLKGKLSSIGNDWDESQSNKKVLRKDGGVLTWFESTGSLQFQGKTKVKEQLEKQVLYLLYPDEFDKPQDTDGTSEEQDTLNNESVDEKGSIEYQYLTSGLSESELVIGVVSAVGTGSKNVINVLTDRIARFGYEVEEIIVSKFLPEYADNLDEYSRIKHYMNEGDKLRNKTKNNFILAAGAAKSISDIRSDKKSECKKAYIINSLKHPDEVDFLRKIYGDGFYLFGIHADVKRRHVYLTDDKGLTQIQADELIKIDEDEKITYGQRTRDTFHLSDFFLNVGNNDDHVKKTLQRFLELIFSNPYKNPTFDEFAMFMAFNSSLRSSDLSRQVGAVISRNKQIIATGANDCPKFGGGQYWAEVNPNTGEVEDKADGKDYTREEDSNKIAQIEIIDEIVDRAVSVGCINHEDKNTLEKVLQNSKISDITEFGRVVHAEMEALLSCGRIGISTEEATLYCTTYPCHNCAKHIVDAGIKRVVYVEPYPKSRALDLHADSIDLNTQLDKEDNDLVSFEPFIGVGARRFLDLFSISLGAGAKLKRKNKDGTTVDWAKETAVIRTPLIQKSYLDIEQAAIAIWDKAREGE